MDNYYSHKADWGDYTEIRYISHDQKVSFGLYWYHTDVNNVVLHELYVSPAARRKGRASRALLEVIKYLRGKTLSLWVNDKKLIPWYEKRGFVLDGRSKEVIWLTYKGK